MVAQLHIEQSGASASETRTRGHEDDMNIRLVLDVAPPTPACFSSRTAWSEYLLAAQRSRKVYALPFDGAVYRTSFNFCVDCSGEHKALMQLASKCLPAKFHVRIEAVSA
jgi:hypothetical protein